MATYMTRPSRGLGPLPGSVGAVVRTATVVAMLAASAGPAGSQGRGMRGGGGEMSGMNAGEMLVRMLEASDPVSFVIERTRELSLADDQVRDLQALRRDARQRNRPLLDTIEKVGGSIPIGSLRQGRRRGGERPDSAGAGEELAQFPDTVRALVRAVRENHADERGLAMALLTDDQRSRLTELEATAREDMRGRGGRGRPAGGRRPTGS
jgi:hypothetical protein